MRLIGLERRQHGQPPDDVAAAVIRLTVTSTSSASVEPRSVTATGLPAFHPLDDERLHPRAILDLIAESDRLGQSAR